MLLTITVLVISWQSLIIAQKSLEYTKLSLLNTKISLADGSITLSKTYLLEIRMKKEPPANEENIQKLIDSSDVNLVLAKNLKIQLDCASGKQWHEVFQQAEVHADESYMLSQEALRQMGFQPR